MTSREDGEPTESGTWARVDAMDRLEREIDHQVTMLDAIDTKAEHVARLVVLLVGVLLTAISISVRLAGGPPETTLTVDVSFAAGMVGLSAAMAAAVVTYLSSRIRLGLHPSTADTFEKVDMPARQYSMLVINTYASVIEDNKTVIDVNSFRFRLTLVAFVVGVSYVSTAILLYLAIGTSPWDVVVLSVATCFVGGIGWYVLTGRYLTIRA